MFRQACSGCRDADIIGGARLSTPIYNGPVTNPLQALQAEDAKYGDIHLLPHIDHYQLLPAKVARLPADERIQ